MKNIWFHIIEFLKNWVYPAYYLRNLLFNRYDIVKIRYFKPYMYYEINNRMFYSTMELICEFMESNPEEHVCWYKDENGNDVGPKFSSIAFKEYNDVYVLDIVKEIYEWWKKKIKGEDELTNDLKYLEDFAYDYVDKQRFYKKNEDEHGNITYVLKDVGCPRKSMEQDTDINYKILRKYFDSNEDLKNEKIVNKKIIELDARISKEEVKYMILAAEIHQYLWT